jgi:hypothetical protein
LHTRERTERHTGIWWSLNEAEYLEHLGIDGRIILKMGVKALGWDGVHWIYLAQDREKW